MGRYVLALQAPQGSGRLAGFDGVDDDQVRDSLQMVEEVQASRSAIYNPDPLR
jgi:hypothetical protein